MVWYFALGERNRDCLAHQDGEWDQNLHTLQPVRDSRISPVSLDDDRDQYWAYYCNSGETASVGLAFSDDLLSWWKFEGNPILSGTPDRDYRWPSPCFTESGDLALFLTDTKSQSLELWTSADGYEFEYEDTLATGTRYFNPYVWQDPKSRRWRLYTHEGEERDSRIACRTAESPRALTGAAPETVLTTPDGWHTVAAPAIMYADNRYWLAVEYKHPAPRVCHRLSRYPTVRRAFDAVGIGGVWKTAVYASETPVDGYELTEDSPILPDAEACAVHLPGPDGENLYLFCNQQRPQWHQDAYRLHRR